jgi:hypothetical protein
MAARRTATYRLTLLLAAVLAGTVLSTAACAKGGDGPGVATAGGGTPSASASGVAGKQENSRQFTECMRDNGIDMDDAKDGQALGAARSGDKRKFNAAFEKCRHFQPNGGAPPKLSPADLDKMRQFAQCVREHGVPEFPDPKPDGSYKLDTQAGEKLRKNSHYQSASDACRQYLPAEQTSGKGGGVG